MYFFYTFENPTKACIFQIRKTLFQFKHARHKLKTTCFSLTNWCQIGYLKVFNAQNQLPFD